VDHTLYVVDRTSENILSLICSGSHLICSRQNVKKVTKLVEFFFLFFQETSHQQKEQCRQVHRTVDRQEKTNPSEVTELS
jgi:hypothetical protein